MIRRCFLQRAGTAADWSTTDTLSATLILILLVFLTFPSTAVSWLQLRLDLVNTFDRARLVAVRDRLRSPRKRPPLSIAEANSLAAESARRVGRAVAGR
jgi:hypothetical protein